MNILVETADGSNTLFNETIGEHYHSAHGAVQESKHVFVNAGLDFFASLGNPNISILEVGFGTGLNFLMSYAYGKANNIDINYVGIEAFPLPLDLITATGYGQYVEPSIWQTFVDTYEAAIDKRQSLSAACQLEVVHQKLQDFNREEQFDIIYFDAFSVRHQPELWTNEMIAYACSFLKKGGIFVTYAITGNLKRAIKSCGLTVEKLPGAPGKREMLRGRL